jgi:hypothetical protein
MHEDGKILRTVERNEKFPDSPDFLFFCPGCRCGHGVWITRPNGITGATWKFNGNTEKPTFEPSLLVTGSEFSAKGREDYNQWMADGHPPRNGKEFDSVKTVCHSIITDGQIHFLGDCTHELAGQIVPMQPF